jgi:hypothetical protein
MMDTLMYINKEANYKDSKYYSMGLQKELWNHAHFCYFNCQNWKKIDFTLSKIMAHAAKYIHFSYQNYTPLHSITHILYFNFHEFCADIQIKM